jgi:hypothetical protein
MLSLFYRSSCPQSSFKSSFLYMFFLYRLLSRVLNIPDKKCKNKSVQTYFESAAANRQLKGSTPRNSLTETRREEPFSSLRNPFRYSPPLYNLYDVGIFTQFSPARQLISPEVSHLVSPYSGDELLRGEVAESKISSSALQKNNELYAIDQNLQTPVRALFQEDYPSASKVVDAFEKSGKDSAKATIYVGTPLHAPPSTRLPRSVSKIKSYKEPSLTVKVRKGFKFFSFEDP